MLSHETATVKPTCTITRLEVEITGADGISHRYAVSEIAPGEDHSRAFELVKRDQKRPAVYHVAHDHVHGLVVCDCPDFCYRREGKTSEPCKHGSSLIQLGLMPAPKGRQTSDNLSTPCCPASEPTPCVPCQASEPDEAFRTRMAAEHQAEYERLIDAYAPYPDESPELSDAECHDPEPFDPDGESDPATWPACPEFDGWYATTVEPEPAPEPEPALVPGIDFPQTFRPSREDREWFAGATLARPAVARPAAPSRRTRSRWDRP